MSYKRNLNLIDNQLKRTFKTVSFNTDDPRKIIIKASDPIVEKSNPKIELSMYVYGMQLNTLDPILRWGYYTDPINEKEAIEFNNRIAQMGTSIQQIVVNERMNKTYLEELNVEMVNESKEDYFSEKDGKYKYNYSKMSDEDLVKRYKFHKKEFEDSGEDRTDGSDGKHHLTMMRAVHSKILDRDIPLSKLDESKEIWEWKTNEFDEEVLIIDTHKLKDFIPNMKIGIDELIYLDKKGNTIHEDPQVGDTCEIILEMSNETENQVFSLDNWMTIKKQLEKLPCVDKVDISTQDNEAKLNFSNKIVVELK